MSGISTRPASQGSVPESSQPQSQPSTDQATSQGTTQEGSATSRSSSDSQFQLRDIVWHAAASIGPAINGRDNGHIFAPGDFGGWGDYVHTNLQLAPLFRLGDYFRAGPELSFDHFRGGHRVFGSDASALSVGAVLELNLAQLWHRAIGDSPITPLPRLRIDARVGVGWGTTTSEQALLENRLGPAVGFTAAADLISLRIDSVEVGLGAYFSTNALYDMGDTNLPTLSAGGLLTIRSSERADQATEAPQCMESSAMTHRIEELASRAQTMRPSYEAHRLMTDALVSQLQGNEQQQRAASQAVEGALAEQGAEATPATDEFLDRVRELYAQALVNQGDVSEQEAQSQAEAFFPNGTQLLNFLTLDPVTETNVTERLARAQQIQDAGSEEDYCAALMDILNDVQEEVINLSRRNGLLRGYIIGALRHQGTGDPETIYEVQHISFQMRNARFNTATPYGETEDRAPGRMRTRATREGFQITHSGVNQAINQQLQASGDSPLTEDQLQGIVRGLFPRSAIPGQTGLRSNRTVVLAGELANNLSTLVERTHQPVIIYFEGHTDTRGGEAMNLRLSQRRAQVIADMVRSRLPASARSQVRFVYRGLGELMPEAPDDNRTLRTTGQTREWTDVGLSAAARREQTQVHLLLNRRTEIRIFNTDQELVDHMQGRHPEITVQTFGETGAPSAFSSQATPRTEASQEQAGPQVTSSTQDLPEPRRPRRRRRRATPAAEPAATPPAPAPQEQRPAAAPPTPRDE